MRLQRKRLPCARWPSDSCRKLRQAARPPMGRVARRRFERRRQYALDVGVGNLSRDTRTRLVELSVRRRRDKSAGPFADRVLDCMQIASDRRGGLAGRTAESQSCPQRESLGRRRTARPAFEQVSFVSRQHNRRCRSAQSHRRVALVAVYEQSIETCFTDL